MKSMYRILFLVAFLFCTVVSDGQEWGFQLGDTLYLYEAQDLGEGYDYVNVDFFSNHVSCVRKLLVEDPDVPNVDFRISDKDGQGRLYKFEDGVIYLKGFVGRDPFFNIDGSYIQFRGEIPLSGITSSDPKSKGTATAYLEYHFKELPAPFPIWGQINGYQKIRLSISIDYSLKLNESWVDDRFAVDAYENTLAYTISVEEVSVLTDEWQVISRAVHPDLEKILKPIDYLYYNLHEKGRGLFYQREQRKPNQNVQFLFTQPRKYVPECMSSEDGVYVFPNPTFGKLNLRIDKPENSPYEFALFDIVGNELWKDEFELDAKQKIISFNLPQFKKGIYLYSVKDADGQYIQSRRLVIIEH